MAIFKDETSLASFTIRRDGTFEEYDTLQDFGLLPVNGQIIFDPPAKKVSYIDVPGASGSLDLTNALVPWDNYSDIEGDIDFYAIDRGDILYADTVDIDPALYRGIHQRKKLILETLCRGEWRVYPNDLITTGTCYYMGRFQLKSIKTNKLNHTIFTISYRLKPFFTRIIGPYRTSVGYLDFEPVSLTIPYAQFDGPSSFSSWQVTGSDRLNSVIELRVINTYLGTDDIVTWTGGNIDDVGIFKSVNLYCPEDPYYIAFYARSHKLNYQSATTNCWLSLYCNGSYLEQDRKLI